MRFFAKSIRVCLAAWCSYIFNNFSEKMDERLQNVFVSRNLCNSQWTFICILVTQLRSFSINLTSAFPFKPHIACKPYLWYFCKVNKSTQQIKNPGQDPKLAERFCLQNSWVMKLQSYFLCIRRWQQLLLWHTNII